MALPSNSAQSVSAILLHPDDNVICLLRNHIAGEKPQISRDESVTIEGPALITNVSLGHKVAIDNIPRSAGIIKYGSLIGHATQDIREGEQVHLNNLAGHIFMGEPI